MRNHNAQQVEIDNGTEPAGEVGQEFANVSVTAQEVDHVDQRSHACVVGRAAIVA